MKNMSAESRGKTRRAKIYAPGQSATKLDKTRQNLNGRVEAAETKLQYYKIG